MKIHPLKSEGKIVYNEILKEDKKIDYEELICIGLGKHRYNFTIFLNLKTFGDSIYEVNLSLRAAKLKQRNMENLIARLDCYAPTNKEYVAQRKSIFDNAREFYKGRKMILFDLKMVYFHYLNNIHHKIKVIGKKMIWIHHTLFLKKLINYYYHLSV